MPNWQIILSTLGISTILVAALSWLAKQLLTHLLSKDLDKHKADIKAGTDREIARFKNELQIAAHERQETFSRLHEKRALFIAELYGKVSGLLGAGQLLGGRLLFGTVRNAEDIANEAFEKAQDVGTYFSRHKIYFSQGLNEAMTELVFAIADVAVQAKAAIDIPESRSDFEKWFSEQLHELLTTFTRCQEVIEAEFRKILGTNEDAN